MPEVVVQNDMILMGAQFCHLPRDLFWLQREEQTRKKKHNFLEHTIYAIQLCIILGDPMKLSVGMRLIWQPRGGRLTDTAGSVYFLHKMSRRLQHTKSTEFHKLNRNLNIKVDETLTGFALGHLLLWSNWNLRSFSSLEHISSDI